MACSDVSNQNFVQHHYEPLFNVNSDIRILQLLPGAWESEIRIRLQCLTLEQAAHAQYEALSYTWGSLQDLATIVVENDSSCASLSVTQNCWEALRYLRFENKSRSLWIDAICINQEDLDERSRQVELMVEIYSKSLFTIAWLGTASPDSDIAISWITVVNKNFAVHPGTDKVYPITNDSNSAEGDQVNITEEETEALANFLTRPWFGRLWIWQEVIFSDERARLKCGKTEIAWKELCVAIWCFQGKPFPGYTATQRLTSQLAYLVARITPSNVSLLETLENMRRCDCTDHRDRIYTAQVFHRDNPNLRVAPNYRLSVRDVYTDFVLRYIDAVGDLEVFGFIMDRNKHCPERDTVDFLPSWVPDWSYWSSSIALPRSHASLGASSVTHSSRNDLRVRGLVTSKVGNSYPFSLDSYAQGTQSERTEALRDMILAVAGSSPTDLQLEELCRVLAGNIYAEVHVPLNLRWPRFEDLKALLMEVLGLSDRRIEGHARGLTIEVITRACFGRSLFQTDSGTFGLGSSNTKPGDCVTVIIGCGLAITLRPLKDSHYRVVGAAYCDGIMGAEALLGPLPPIYRRVRLQRQDTYYYLAYQNIETGEAQLEDPRLPELPPEWEEISQKENTPFLLYKNVTTGEFRHYFRDPRCDADALEKRGVRLQEFVLV